MESKVERKQSPLLHSKKAGSPSSQFFRAIKCTSLILLTSAIVGFISPKSAAAQEKEKPGIEGKLLPDSLGFDIAIENGNLHIYKPGSEGIINLAARFSNLSFSTLSSSDIVRSIPAEVKAYGDGAYLVFKDWVLGVFPVQGKNGAYLPIVYSPGGDSFYASDSSYAVLPNYDIILLAPQGVSGMISGGSFSVTYSSRSLSVPMLVSPKLTVSADSTKNGRVIYTIPVQDQSLSNTALTFKMSESLSISYLNRK